jgi:Arc/MetJ-type ribon-helix-helix transcriptional regulator
MKFPGRPKGAANLANGHTRHLNCSFRCTEAFDQILKHLVASGQYKSKADVMHEALQLLALKKVTNDAYKHRINNI